jgi:uncharacterized lipoprotein YddW (UPF0748 family)
VLKVTSEIQDLQAQQVHKVRQAQALQVPQAQPVLQEQLVRKVLLVLVSQFLVHTLVKKLLIQRNLQVSLVMVI